MRVRLNGQDGARRRLEAEGVGFVELDWGFAATVDPARLHSACPKRSTEDIAPPRRPASRV